MAERGQVERRVEKQQQQQTFVVPKIPHHLGVGGQGGARNRSVSHSVKRRRGLDGEAVEEERSQSKSRQKKFVVETSSSVQTGRKMRSPTANIFVYGVHPLTSVEDIVADLAESDVKIEVTDIYHQREGQRWAC